MKVILLIACSALLYSCKKEYKCHCTTLDPNQGFVANPADYTTKEKNEEDAMVTCATKYNNSGLATGGINCQVTQP